jgi:hypothetical protein
MRAQVYVRPDNIFKFLSKRDFEAKENLTLICTRVVSVALPNFEELLL